MDCGTCEKTDVKCCPTCNRASLCDVWHTCGEDCPGWEEKLVKEEKRMKETPDVLEVIKEAIEKEMESFAKKLQVELAKKYTQEFFKEMLDHRRKVVLAACENIKIAQTYDPIDMRANIVIKL